MKNLVWMFAATMVLATVSPASASTAELKKYFTKINTTYKGPFGPNVLQGSRGRGEIRGGGGSSGKRQFQAAFRNETARYMAKEFDFYTGNLFTTNYYELTGEYVYGKPYGSHELDQERLIAAGPRAIEKASSMVRHWVLEKHFIAAFPLAEITKAFTLRGISDSANEQEYANHFFNFYVTILQDDYQYLPAFLLVNRSPIMDSASLAKARDLIAQVYDRYAGTEGGGGWTPAPNPGRPPRDRWWDPRRWFNEGGNFLVPAGSAIQELYKLRNAIHNQLSPEVIGMLDTFLKNFPEYKRDRTFGEIRAILVEYYGINPSKISARAKALGLTALVTAADSAATKNAQIAGLLEMSRVAAVQRGNMTQIPLAKRAQVFALLADTAKVLNKEISALKAETTKSADVLETIVNTIYLEGYLIKDNWEFFVKDVRASNQPANVLGEILEASAGTLSEAFKPSYDQWVAMEPKMQGFLDNVMKASALNTASQAIEKLRK